MNLVDAPLIAAAEPALARLSGEPAYVLHAWPWRESSLIVEFFTRAHGRIAAVAKGSRRPRSAVRGLLEPFSLLAISASGKGEVKTLGKVEWLPTEAGLTGLAMLSGYYANELILAVLARHDPHPEVFDAYVHCLAGLSISHPDAPLRHFEKALLLASGMAPDFVRDSAAAAIDPALEYRLVEGQGWVITPSRAADAVQAGGQTLLHIAAGRFDEPGTRTAVRLLLRALLQRAAHGATRAVGHRSRQAWLEYSALMESAAS
jgi:DNA repair protein RecO (recombination protein O)